MKKTKAREFFVREGETYDLDISNKPFFPNLRGNTYFKVVDREAFDELLELAEEMEDAAGYFARIEAHDGDNFEGVHEDVVLRVEITAGELHYLRDVLWKFQQFKKDREEG